MANNQSAYDSHVSGFLLRSLPLIIDTLQHSMNSENKQISNQRTINGRVINGQIMNGRIAPSRNTPGRIGANARKQILVERISTEMETNGTTPNLEAFLAQVLACNDSQISRFEEVFNEVHGSPQPLATPSVIFNSILRQSILPTSLFTQIQPPVPPVPAVKEEEKKICISFKDLKRASMESNCAICLEKFIESDEVEIRHCAHTFHKSCLITWEKTGRTNGKLCPCCRS